MYKDARSVRSRLGQGLAAAFGGSATPQAGHYRLARSRRPRRLREPEEPAAERPVETPEIDHPGGACREDRAPGKARGEGGQTRPATCSEKRRKPDEKPRKGFLRRHPILAAVGLIALLLAVAAGYVYWTYLAFRN